MRQDVVPEGVFFLDYSMMGKFSATPGCLYTACRWFDKHGYPCIVISDATEINKHPNVRIPAPEVWDAMFAEAFKPKKQRREER